MKLDQKSFNILAILAMVLFSALSFLVTKIPQLLTFMFIALIVTIAFLNMEIYNTKIYFSTLIIILGIITYEVSSSFNLINILFFIFPILGALTLATVMSRYLEKIGLIRKSLSLIGMNKFQESVDNSDKLLELYPEDYSGLLVKAYALGYLGRYQEQLELSDKLIVKKLKKSKEIAALSSKTDALLKLKRYNDAEKIVENVLKKDPKNEAALSHKAYLLSEHGHYSEAIEYYKNSLEIIDKKLLKLKKSRLARIIHLNQGLGEIWVNKGKTHQKLHQYNEALESFNKALELEPDYEPAKNAREEHLKLIRK